MLAGRVGPVVAAGSGVEERPNELLPAPPALQAVGVLHDVAGLVAQDAHAFRPGAALDLEDHLALQPHQARMGEVERDGDARRVVGAEPFVGHPGVRPDPKPRCSSSS